MTRCGEKIRRATLCSLPRRRSAGLQTFQLTVRASRFFCAFFVRPQPLHGWARAEGLGVRPLLEDKRNALLGVRPQIDEAPHMRR